RGDRRSNVVNVQPDVVEAGSAIGIRRQQLDEGVATHLHVGKRRLPFVVAHDESFREPHLLFVEGQGFVEVLDADADVVHAVQTGEPVSLSDSRCDRTTYEQARHKYEGSPHATSLLRMSSAGLEACERGAKAPRYSVSFDRK